MGILDRSPKGNLISPLNQYYGTLDQIAFNNPRLPQTGSPNAQNAIDYLFAVVYPNYKGTVANPAALPLVGNLANDYYIVSDDGDGKSAGYVWAIVDNAGAWSKKYDVDWSYEGIYAETIVRTQYLYVSKYGTTDKDNSGADVVGIYAGQRVYGGNATGQNLTFNANSADATGFVQTDNSFRPTADNTLDIGTGALKFQTGYFGTSVLAGTLTLSSGSIVDSSGAISFGNENLTTTGDISGAIITGSTSLKTGTMTITGGNIADTSGAISFNALNLTTTGFVQATSFKAGTTTLSAASLDDTSGNFSFNALNLTTTGTLGAGNTTVTQLDAGNLRLAANTLSSTNANGNIILLPNGTGIIDLQKAATTLGVTATGNISATGTGTFGNIQISGNTILSTNVSGNIILSPNGAGIIQANATIDAGTDASFSIGLASNRFTSIFLSAGISDGTTSIAQTVLQSLRNINVGVTTGMTIFWNGSQWVPSIPDTEITHDTLSGLTTGDAGHTQFVMLAGRSGGQVVQGGTNASENLVFESTSNASKGLVLTKDAFAAFTNASFSGTWAGIDIGAPTNYFRHSYFKGEHFGFRFENVAALPSNSAQNVGRTVYLSTVQKLMVDNGTTWVTAGSTIEKFSSDTTWDGIISTLTVTVSSTISEARTALWQFLDNANNFERINTKIEAISATQVRISTLVALPAGTYRLVGIN